MNVQAAVTAGISKAKAGAPQRARGRAFVSSKARAGKSVLDDLAMSGSMKALFPRPASDGLDVMLINTAGGITGGDDFALSASAGAGTTMTFSTQACERAYRAIGHAAGRMRSDLSIEAGARLNWLPQETILFEGANLDRSLSIEMEETSSLLMVEPLLFGRLAMGETITSGRFCDVVDIRRSGTPLYLDRVRLEGDIAHQLDRPATAAGARAMAAVVYVAPDAEARLGAARDLLPGTAGASLLAPDVLVMRVLAPDGFALRRALVPIIRLLNHDEIPRPWML